MHVLVLLRHDPDGGVEVLCALSEKTAKEQVFEQIRDLDFSNWVYNPIDHANEDGVELLYVITNETENGYMVTFGYGEEDNNDENDNWYEVQRTEVY